MGHLNFKQLSKLESMADGVGKLSNIPQEKCEVCILVKSTRQSFKGKDPETRSKAVGEIVSSDLGFVGERTDRGEHCYVTYTEHASDATVVALLRNKSEQAQEFMTYTKFMETQFGVKIKTLKSDNGGEYVCKELKHFCNQNGIRLLTSSPYTPEQNGRAERKNRTLIEMAKSMLRDSGLEHKYWGDALLTATYLRNRSPTRANGGEKTPIEILSGERPNLKKIMPERYVFSTLTKHKDQNFQTKMCASRLHAQRILCSGSRHR